MPKYIGETNDVHENGKSYAITLQEFTGRQYKNLDDRYGWKDERVMAFGTDYYKVFSSPEDVLKTWELSVRPSGMPRMAPAWDRFELSRQQQITQ